MRKGQKVSVYFPNQAIYKRDTELFWYVFKEFESSQPRFHYQKKIEETPFYLEDLNEEDWTLIFDEFDSIFFESKQFMAVLNQTKSCGVTATAHWKDGESTTEKELLTKLGFKIFSLFPSVKPYETIDFSSKTYWDLWKFLLQESFSSFATLLVGLKNDI